MTKANDSGQALLEVAICLTLFVILVIGTMDFGFLFYTQLTLQNAVRQAGRYAVTGQCITGSNGACSESRYNSIVQTLQTASDGLLNSSNAGDISITCTNVRGGCPTNAGGPGDIVNISVTYVYSCLNGPIAAFFPGGYTIRVSGAFTNEPFPPSSS